MGVNEPAARGGDPNKNQKSVRHNYHNHPNAINIFCKYTNFSLFSLYLQRKKSF